MKISRISILFLVIVFLSSFLPVSGAVYAAAGVVTVDGAVSSGTLASGSSITVSHTTGTGTNRLMLVGVSWNTNTSAVAINTVTFTPSGGSATSLNPVITQQAGTQFRYVAIYSLLNPSSGVSGTVTVSFAASVPSGIIAGAINFAGVDQTTPLGTSNGAGSTSGTGPSVTLTGLNGNELVFDTAFKGGAPPPALNVGAGQTEQWNANIGNARGAASTEQATTTSVTMSWSATGTGTPWAIAAVPINPIDTFTVTYDGNGNTSGTAPVDALSPYNYNATVTVLGNTGGLAKTGYTFNNWNTQSDGLGTPYAPAATFAIAADTTLYAQWTQDTFTISGIIAEVLDGTAIPGATVKLYLGDILKSTTTSDQDGQYELVATETGAYTVVASAVGFKDETQGISILSLGGGSTLDFIGNHGLIPQAPDMSYVLACANNWLYPPADPELALSMSKVLAVANAWLQN